MLLESGDWLHLNDTFVGIHENSYGPTSIMHLPTPYMYVKAGVTFNTDYSRYHFRGVNPDWTQAEGYQWKVISEYQASIEDTSTFFQERRTKLTRHLFNTPNGKLLRSTQFVQNYFGNFDELFLTYELRDPDFQSLLNVSLNFQASIDSNFDVTNLRQPSLAFAQQQEPTRALSIELLNTIDLINAVPEKWGLGIKDGWSVYRGRDPLYGTEIFIVIDPDWMIHEVIESDDIDYA